MQRSKNEQRHLNHPFYKDANEYREHKRIGQILKGAHKYPEPFTTSSWTSEQIIEHAMQENVDQAHYIYAAHERMQELEQNLREAEQTIRELQRKDRVSRYLELEQENLRLVKLVEKLTMQLNAFKG